MEPPEGDVGVPSYLRDSEVEPPATVQAPRRGRRTIILAVSSLLLAAAIGSAATVVVDRTHHNTPTPTAAESTTTPPSVPPNEVARVGEPATLNGWTLVVRKFALSTVYERERARAGQKWLTTTVALTNSVGVARAFALPQIQARYFQGGTWVEVPARLSGSVGVGAKQTIPEVLGFSVPTSSGIYSVVMRRDLEAEKQSGDAVEIDLNCC